MEKQRLCLLQHAKLPTFSYFAENSEQMDERADDRIPPFETEVIDASPDETVQQDEPLCCGLKIW